MSADHSQPGRQPHPKRDRRAKPPIPAPLSSLLAPIYRLGLAHNNNKYDAGKGVTHFGIPIISVGNLSVGGTGKTPTVMWVVAQLIELVKRPAIAMRGYKAKADQLSDEQAEYIERYPGIPVIAQPDRAAGITGLVRQGNVDVVVLDDGFQHRKVARDLDIVLIDATRDVFKDRLLPAGWLRETPAALRRAHAVIITHADRVDAQSLENAAKHIQSAGGPALICAAAHTWTHVDEYRTSSDPLHLHLGERARAKGDRSTKTFTNIDTLQGLPVVCALGIGHPSAFINQLEQAGAQLVHTDVRADHHHWSAQDVAQLAEQCAKQNEVHGDGHDPVLVTSQKDWVKLRAHEALLPARVLVPQLGITLIEPTQATPSLRAALDLQHLIHQTIS